MKLSEQEIQDRLETFKNDLVKIYSKKMDEEIQNELAAAEIQLREKPISYWKKCGAFVEN